LYVDRYENGSGREGYMKRERVWRISTKPKEGYGPKGKSVEEAKVEEKLKVGEKVEERDELKELLGLDLTPRETGPPKTGVAALLNSSH